MRHLAFLLALALALPASAQGTLDVTFRFIPDLTTTPSPPIVQAFLPGQFNDWGQPYVSGVPGARIANTHPSRMTFEAALNEYRYTIALPIGSNQQYKVQAHTNTSGTTGFTWLSDPLNPVTVGPDANSLVEVRDPMVFQLAREQRGATQIQAVSASVFGTQPITAIAFEVNGVRRTDGLQFFDPQTRLFRYTLPAPLAPGAQFRIEATDALGRVAQAQVGVVPPAVQDAPVPAGLVDGINFHDGDPGRVTLVLRAPGKQFVHAIGDFNAWEVRDEFLLKRDATDPLGTRWWIELTGLPAGQEVRFQYLVDGQIRVSDPYAPKVLDQANDPFIGPTRYPGLIAYPVGQTTHLVSVIRPGAPPYPWQTTGWVRPPVEDLVVYELLLRDFVAQSDFRTLRDTLDYLVTLGVNAIGLMPISEFDGNDSWGYNPNHYFAVDKYYGPAETFKALVDEAHARGLAVILDVVYNHQTGQAPFVRLYNTGDFGPPTPDNPWVNPTARHPFNVFNDNNHESPLTKYWLDRANAWWLQEYRVDGYRFDLSKGFTQTCGGGPCTDANFSAYNQARIDILTRMADRIWEVDPNAYVILEHFADASEERVLANHGRAQGRPGMTLWSNVNVAYNEATMGYLNAQSSFARAYPPNNGYPLHGQLTYMESHDEQWMMFRNRRYGACTNAPAGGATCNTNPGAYNTRDLNTALERQALAAAFFLTVPGPKMIWQFGELGYGGGPGECLKPGSGNGDCLASDPARTGRKPIRWEYFHDPARRRLFDTYRQLLYLRNTEPVFRRAQTVQMQTGAGVADRWIKLSNPDLSVVVAGNFGLAERTATYPLDPGIWYDFFSREAVTVPAGGLSLTLAPGTFRLFTSREISPAPASPYPSVSAESGPAGAPALRFETVFPNPVAGRATVRFTTDAPGEVRLEAFDTLGRRVATLADGLVGAGAHEAAFDASGLPAGVYVLRLSGAGRVASARVTVAR